MATPSTDPEFWNVRYAASRTPWDHGGVPAALQRYLRQHPGAGRRLLIPGCGSGYEVAACTAAGYTVTAIDFSAAAVARARSHLPPSLHAAVIEGDFFTHPLPLGGFDVVYERTFLCALPPERWPAIIARTAALLDQGGVLAGLYVFGEKEDGPPYGLSEEEPAALFGSAFEELVDQSIPAAESLPLFAGCERWQERRKRASAPNCPQEAIRPAC